jgi:hypothetical protein
LDLLGQARAAYKDQLPPAKTTPASDYPTPYERTISLLNWLQNSPYMAQFEEQLRKASRYYNVILFVWDQVQPAFRAARGQLAAFDPALHGASAYPEADAFGVVETLSRYLQAGRSLS